jgi:hypothetical protein
LARSRGRARGLVQEVKGCTVSLSLAGVSIVGRDVGAGLSCLFQLVVFSVYYLVAFLLGSRLMAAAPIVVAVVTIAWAVVRARLEGEQRPRESGRNPRTGRR